ncbi:MAG TPA: hypothetical protein VLG11_05655 [Candidatus Saccharimonadales bacterium]|nr:hypothetical protein [Candidatus Saccharimonadales bacterium]
MTNHNPNVLIAGAGASQAIFGNRFTNPDVMPLGVQPDVTFYDPNPAVKLRDDMPYLRAGMMDGRVKLVHTLPDETFDIAVVATASDRHAAATKAILDHHSEPPFFIFEKPVAATREDLAWFQGIEPQVQSRSLVNEPYFFLESLRNLVSKARNQTEAESPLTEVCVWSSKKRAKANPHGELGIYAIELPHTHGAASWIADEVLDLSNVQENVYFADVQGVKDNDGNYMRFEVDGVAYHVAQGLGAFVMDRYGSMLAHQDPPRTRRVAMGFADGSSTVLDVDPAFPFTQSQRPPEVALYHYDIPDGEPATSVIADDPRSDLVRHAVERVLNLAEPAPGVSLGESLARNQALLDLRASAEIRRGVAIAAA